MSKMILKNTWNLKVWSLKSHKISTFETQEISKGQRCLTFQNAKIPSFFSSKFDFWISEISKGFLFLYTYIKIWK